MATDSHHSAALVLEVEVALAAAVIVAVASLEVQIGDPSRTVPEPYTVCSDVGTLPPFMLILDPASGSSRSWMAWEPRPQFWGEAAQARPTINLSLSLLLLLLSSRTWYRYLIHLYYPVNDPYFDGEPQAGSRQPSASSSSTCPSGPGEYSSLVPYCPGSGQAVLFNTLPGPDVTEKVIYRYHALYHHLGLFGPSTN